jgi:hypothetical protein
MKKILLIIFIFQLISCKKQVGSIDVIVAKSEITDSTSSRLFGLSLKNSDSTFYKFKGLNSFKFQDTIKIDSIPVGEYELEYLDIIGNKVSKSIEVKRGKPNVFKILTDSIDSRKFENEIPFSNLNDNSFYTVEKNGGCVVSLYGFYKISRIGSIYYIESSNLEKKKLSQKDIIAIIKFESELFAINGKEICSSTGRNIFTITTDKVVSITDDTCNWNGWSNLFFKLNNTN